MIATDILKIQCNSQERLLGVLDNWQWQAVMVIGLFSPEQHLRCLSVLSGSFLSQLVTMIQTSTLLGNSLNTYSSGRILCSYTNVTHHIQMIRIKNISDLYFEQVIFPGQRLMFEAVLEANLEIQYTDNMSIFVPCDQLRVTEKIQVNQLGN
ncbi:DUF1830 domain-containing protein [Allocoleopsis sp.]|uniref:DUF1830 domain-containing protein n=1 Tax=Allocoleopsis sp. TaxID=3088169 RepID=UPI002FD58184